MLGPRSVPLRGAVARAGLLALALLAAACQGETVGEAATDAGTSGGSAGSGAVGGASGSGGDTTGGSGGSVGTGASGGSVGTGATAGTGSTGGATGVTGPGPFGALPAGYCCEKNEDCRYRNCADFAGVKLCSDECDHDSGCNTGQNMVCSKTTFYCEPALPPTCIAANQWVNGTKKIGACCVATNDGHSGEECEGNRCVAVGDYSNPYICTNACSSGAQCPPGYECLGGLFCAPLASLYTCE